jgi:hypothetical protein
MGLRGSELPQSLRSVPLTGSLDIKLRVFNRALASVVQLFVASFHAAR